MSDINNTNNEYSSPTKNYNEQTYGNLKNEIIKGIHTSEIRFQVEEMIKGIRTSMPGIVQKTFEKDKAIWVEVQPGLSGQLRNGNEFKLPIIRAPLGKFNIAGFEIDYPDPVQGDEVEIRCADRSISTFIKEAGVGVPQTVSILSLNNAYVFPISFSNIKRKRNDNATETSLTISTPKSHISIVDDGKFSFINENGEITLSANGDIDMVNNNGYIKLNDSTGQADINGNLTVDA